MYNSSQEPDIPAALSALNNLSNDELKELLNDDGKFEDVMKDIKQFKDLETEKEMLMASNRSLAEFNLSKQPELEDGKKEIRELGEKGSELCATVQEKIQLVKEKSGSMSVETALELLQAAAAEIEEESEKLAEKFLAGNAEVEEFLDQFLTIRNLMHLRKVKVDKMRELRKRSASIYPSSGGPGYPPVQSSYPPPPPPPSGMTSGLAYPTGPISMPMPGYRPFI